MPPFGLTQTGPEMYSWYLATESHTRRVARICSGMHRVCTRSSVTRRLRWSWVPASHHRRAMTRRLSTAERARSLDCEEESAAGKDDGRSLMRSRARNLGARGEKWGSVRPAHRKPRPFPSHPPLPSPRSLHPPFPCPRKWKAPPHKQRRRSGSGGREGDIESGRRSARQSRERARGRPRAAVWERESEEQQQPSASRGASGEDPETAALRQS